MLNITAMKARADEWNIEDFCIKSPAPQLKSFCGVVRHHLSDDATTNHMNAYPDFPLRHKIA